MREGETKRTDKRKNRETDKLRKWEEETEEQNKWTFECSREFWLDKSFIRSSDKPWF